MDDLIRTYCRNCEALCGLVANVEHGQLVALRPDRDHPASRGYACAKGVNMVEVQNNPARVVHPLRRGPDGTFSEVSWAQANRDISTRLARIVEQYGPHSVGLYLGNPAAFSGTHTVAAMLFMRALGSRQLFSAVSQDGGNRFAASALLYGDPTVIPVPDLDTVETLLVLGANPFVSNGSLVVAPRIAQRLRDITARGGHVVVVDPRGTETARAFEHIAIRPGTDIWLLMAMVNTVLAAGAVDPIAKDNAASLASLAAVIAPATPEVAAQYTGIGADQIRALALRLASPRAAIYTRTGACTGQDGTVLAALVDIFLYLTGNLNRAGATVCNPTPWVLKLVARLAGFSGYRRWHLCGIPEVMGFLPAVGLNHQLDRGADRGLRALFVSGGNPVLSVPGGSKLGAKLASLDLLVSLDLIVNDTNRHADYVLPATTWLERSDTQVQFLPLMLEPTVQRTGAVLAPRGDAREERLILGDLLTWMPATSLWRTACRKAAGAVLRMDLTIAMKILLRLITVVGTYRIQPFGFSGTAADPTRRVSRRQQDASRKVPEITLSAPPILGELQRILGSSERYRPPRTGYLLIGRREFGTLNSWLHLKGARKPRAMMAQSDVRREGFTDGEEVQITSATGSVVAVIEATPRLLPGVVSLPHGWGALGSAVNVNDLTPSDVGSLEPLAGMAHLNGVHVEIRSVSAAPASEASPSSTDATPRRSTSTSPGRLHR
ncbi:hypothetical protein BVU76_04005 [Mycolicibacterium porcinum]|nr:hypothetical protein BVU76_04005 [Mycolicibacterium porcinum]